MAIQKSPKNDFNRKLMREDMQKKNFSEVHVLLNAINDAQSHFITDSEEWILFKGLLENHSPIRPKSE